MHKDAKIIDIGGGDSKLVDYLLDTGYRNITVLDISEKALEKAQKRLSEKSNTVTWIVADITDFQPTENYDVWHDRAAFHFLTTEEHITKYLQTVNAHVNEALIIGTFSEQGPKKCSGLNIKQYSEKTLKDVFKNGFTKIDCLKEVHTTPFNTSQDFLFCSFKR